MFSEHTPFAKWFITVSSIERSCGNYDLPGINIFQCCETSLLWECVGRSIGSFLMTAPELMVLRNRSQEACLSLHWLNCWATRRVLLKGGMLETNWKLSRDMKGWKLDLENKGWAEVEAVEWVWGSRNSLNHGPVVLELYMWLKL